MRILLINQYAGSPSVGMEYRPHWMALEWQRLGHDVLIVAADWSHYRPKVLPVRSGRALVDGVQFEVVRALRHGPNGPKRFGNILAFAAALRLRAGSLAKWRPDVVVASSTHPMDVRPSMAIARRAGAAFVHEVHDLWPLTPRLLGGFRESHPLIRVMQREEDLACRSADAVVSILPGTKDYLVGRGLDPDRWSYISNGVPADAVAEQPTPPPPGGGALRIGYFGAHGLANDLDTLIAAARIVADDPVEFHLTGDGQNKARLQRQAADLPNVHFHDRVSPDTARTRMAQMDVLVWGGRDSPLYRHGVAPNKAFDYMAAARPVLSHLDAPSPCTEAGCDIAVRGGDPAALAGAIRAYAAMPEERRWEMGLRGWNYVAQRATYPVLAAQMLAVLETAVGSARSRRQAART